MKQSSDFYAICQKENKMKHLNIWVGNYNSRYLYTAKLPLMYDDNELHAQMCKL